MTISLCPEDMLIEHVTAILNGKMPKNVPKRHLEQLPPNIEFSEEFYDIWQHLVKSAIRKAVSYTFGLRPFLIDCSGSVEWHTAADDAFWENISFNFSHRSAERLYEHMLDYENNKDITYIIAKPDDALFISLCLRKFGIYRFEWLMKNNASWLVKAMFVVLSQCTAGSVPWLPLIDNPEQVELPLREVIIDVCSGYLNAICTSLLRSVEIDYKDDAGRILRMDLKLPEYNGVFRRGERFNNYLSMNMLREPITFFDRAEKTFDAWQNDLADGLDDAKYIAGAMNKFAFAPRLAIFRSVVQAVQRIQNEEKEVYESVLRN